MVPWYSGGTAFVGLAGLCTISAADSRCYHLRARSLEKRNRNDAVCVLLGDDDLRSSSRLPLHASEVPDQCYTMHLSLDDGCLGDRLLFRPNLDTTLHQDPV